MTQTKRLAKCARDEHRHSVGYPYPERAADREWVAAHLPKTHTGLLAVVAEAKADGWMALDEEIGDLLIRVAGLTARPTAWTPPKRRKKRRACCAVCGAPAMSRANFGPACMDHYDQLS